MVVCVTVYVYFPAVYCLSASRVKFACLVLVVFVGELLMTFGMVGGIVYSSFHTEAREII